MNYLQENDFGPLNEVLMRKAQFIKAAHHGSRFSSDIKIWEEMLDLNGSEVASHVVFSAGVHKKWKHPHNQTISEIQEVCTRFDAAIPQNVPLCTLSSTNGCAACEPDFDGYFSLDEMITQPIATPSRKQKAKVDRILGQHLRVNPTQERPDQNLGALMYEFESQAGGVKIFKGTSRAWKNLRFERQHTPCALHNTRHCPEVKK
ncbi:MAG: hypothetical protein AAFR59_19390 [Bacteroidota bacterium]